MGSIFKFSTLFNVNLKEPIYLNSISYCFNFYQTNTCLILRTQLIVVLIYCLKKHNCVFPIISVPCHSQDATVFNNLPEPCSGYLHIY